MPFQVKLYCMLLNLAAVMKLMYVMDSKPQLEVLVNDVFFSFFFLLLNANASEIN